MTKYRAFLADWFEDIEAESEQEAINEMAKHVIDRLTNEPASDLISAWANPECQNFTHVRGSTGHCTRCGVKLATDDNF